MKKIRLKRIKNYRAIIDVTPMIDLIVLLMIFFLVTSSFGRLSSVDVNLPKASQSAEKVSGDVVVSINSKNEFFINDSPVARENIASELGKIDPKSKVILRGDKNSNYDSVVWVIDILNRGGIKNFVLATVKPAEN